MTPDLERVDVVDGQVPLPGMPEPPEPVKVLSPLDHVLAAIDGALEDWTVSDDAMRWSPTPEDADELDGFGGEEYVRPVSGQGRCWNGAPLEFEPTRLLTFREPEAVTP